MSEEIIKQNEALGSALVSEAQQKYENAVREALVADVERLIKNKNESAEKVEFYKKATAWFDGKIKALQAGEFYFNERTGQIVLNNPDYQRANY